MAQTHFEQHGEAGDYQAGVAFMEELASDVPLIPWRLVAVGRSVQGRTIYGAQVGADPVAAEDVVLLTCSIHSGETSCRESGLQYIRQLVTSGDSVLQDYFTTVCWIIIPTTQADTYGQFDKTNANGVDINEDYLAQSQPETRAIIAQINQYPVNLVLDSHEGAMTSDYSIAAPTVKYGIHPAVQAVCDSVQDQVIEDQIAAGIDSRKWDAFQTHYRGRNAVASEWGIPNLLLETAVNDGVAARVSRTLITFEAAREHHAANRAAYRDAKEAARSGLFAPSAVSVERAG